MIKAHPEWVVAFLLTVFSLFAIFPVVIIRGAWGWLATSLLMAAFLGGAAFSLWGRPAALAVAASLLPLPYFWSFTGRERSTLATWQYIGRTLANTLAVLLFFAIISLFVGAGLTVGEDTVPLWAAPVFAGLLALGMAAFLFPDAAEPIMVILAVALEFVFFLVVAFLALLFFVAEPARLAFGVASVATASVTLMLYLDKHGHKDAALWLCGLVVLAVVPLALVALWRAVIGDDTADRLMQATAGGGALASAGWLAVRVGLGGLFGGGGASR